MSFKKHTNCRICNSEKLTPYIDLGNLPLSNNLCDTFEEDAPTYPLEVMLCEDCGLSQLSIVVNPEILFSHYVYRSSISQGYKDHCRTMARKFKNDYKLDEHSFMIDIAGNDGALLNEFKQEIGLKVLNVDPAENLVKMNDEQGIRMFTTFWGTPAAKHLIDTDWPKADLITATNVFAHVDDVYDFIYAAKMVLKETGVLVLEFPYLIDFIENNEFDTIYFEHNSYFSIRPLELLCEKIGLTVQKVEKQDIHGGTVRVYIGNGISTHHSVNDFIIKELRYSSIYPYKDFALNAKETISNFKCQLNKLKDKGFKIAAFAASAKGNTLLNCAEITYKEIDYIIDQTPEKLDKFSPGTKIPIVPMSELNCLAPDYLIILSWNFQKEIIKKCRDFGYTGSFIIPIPNFTICN